MNAHMTTLYGFPKVLEMIFRECEDSDVIRLDKLENRVIKEVAGYVEKFPDRAKNLRAMSRLVKKYVYSYRPLYATEQSAVFSTITYEDCDGKEQEYEPVDVLANVESEVMKQATVDLLAQADRRKRVILTEWANGNTIDSDISLALAREIGGNTESHRKAIQRFRIECKRALLSAV